MIVFNYDDFGYDVCTTDTIIRHFIPSQKISVMVGRVKPSQLAWINANVASEDVGLHIDLVEDWRLELSMRNFRDIKKELTSQIDSFNAQFGKPPAHIDFHQNSHKNPSVLIAMASILRTHRPTRYVRPLFQYGRRDVLNVFAFAADVFMKTASSPASAESFHGILPEIHTFDWDTIKRLHNDRARRYIAPLHPTLVPAEIKILERLKWN